MTDCIFPLSSVWSVEVCRFGDGLRLQENAETVFDILETEIAKRLGDISQQFTLWRAIELLIGGDSVGQVVSKLDLPTHAFRSLFHRKVGASPKRFLRIERFRQTIAKLAPSVSLSDLAYQQEISDQFHMTREISHFASLSQHKLRKRYRPYVSYVSADSLIDKDTGSPYFLARIAISEKEARFLGDELLLPGMPADVFILTGGTTPLEYLIKPLLRPPPKPGGRDRCVAENI